MGDSAPLNRNVLPFIPNSNLMLFIRFLFQSICIIMQIVKLRFLAACYFTHRHLDFYGSDPCWLISFSVHFLSIPNLSEELVSLCVFLLPLGVSRG